MEPVPVPPGPRRRVRPIFFLCLAAVVLISALDWLTPAGVVVGIFLGVPIALSSTSDRPLWVVLTGGAAMACFAVAAVLGRGPISPAAVWVPNRVFVFLTLPAITFLALALQRGRLQAESARDLNRLLMSLLAHDLRAPLVLSAQAMDYVRGAAERGETPDPVLVGDTADRVRRSLRAIEVVLEVARAQAEAGGRVAGVGGAELAAGLRAELDSFTPAAGRAGKTLRLEEEPGARAATAADPLVLRQMVAILVDNGVRYADPGALVVRRDADHGGVVVRVCDPGPGITAHRAAHGASDGSGLGIELAAALARRAGGRLELEHDGPGGTTWALRLPGVRMT